MILVSLGGAQADVLATGSGGVAVELSSHAATLQGVPLAMPKTGHTSASNACGIHGPKFKWQN